MEIIPAILEKKFEQINEKVKLCEGIFNLIQLDICDGNFVPYTTWQKADDLKQISTPCVFEVHLMVQNPEEAVRQWFWPKIKRIIFHIEARGDYLTALNLIKNADIQTGLAINPKTPLEKIKNIPKELIDEILFLGVTPGKQGQKFQLSILSKIKKFQEIFPKMFPKTKIGVDGGVNSEVAKKLKNLPIDYLVIGSYFWRNLTGPSVKSQKEKLRQLLKKLV